MQNKQMTMDSGLAFLVGQLVHVESKLYEVEYAQITYPKVLPVSFEAGEWATSIEYFSMDGAAVAKWLGSKAFDVPMVDLSSSRTIIPVELAGIGYDYSLEELRQAQHLNRPLPQLKANLARRGFEEMTQRVAMTGDASKGYEGFVNNSNVTAASVVNPGSGTEWSNKTPDEIITDFTAGLNAIFEDSEMIESADKVAIPPEQWGLINSTPRSANSDTTILDYIVANSPYLNSKDDIMPLNELKSAGAGSTDRMVIYTKSEDKIIYHIPMPLRFSAPQAKGLGFEVPGEFKLGGFEVRFPGSMRYFDGI